MLRKITELLIVMLRSHGEDWMKRNREIIDIPR